MFLKRTETAYEPELNDYQSGQTYLNQQHLLAHFKPLGCKFRLTGQTSNSAKRCNIICHTPQASHFQHQSFPTETGPTLPFVVEKASPAQIHGTTAQID